MRFRLLACTVFIGLLSSFSTAYAASTVDHSAYDALLKRYAKEGVVNYKALKKDRASLDAYINQGKTLTSAQFGQWSKDEQLAYLINQYNAVTLQLIIDHYPVDSIKDIGSIFTGPWDQSVVPLFGEVITLNDLEHKIIRKEYDEPRIHVALVCAAKSCPGLRSEAYTGADLERQLTVGMKAFLQDRTKNRLDPAQETWHLSSIFKWYGKDFTKKGNTLAHYLQPYLSNSDKAAIQGKDVSIRYLSYDWSLNE